MSAPKLRAVWDYTISMWRTADHGFLLNCHECNALVAAPKWRSYYWCPEHEPNWRKRERLRGKAHYAVSKAIRAGDLRPATSFQCTDCPRPAKCYDHRDYSQPLKVQPVCCGCNSRRGHAIQREFLTRERK